MYIQFFKRIIDFTLSFIGLIVLLPLILFIIILLFFANKGDVFFLQARPGLNTRIFNIIKFKTMKDEVPGNANLLSDADRVTSIGNFIRKFSLDEILQLLNVLMGDMSLIGPRPLLIEYLPLYNDSQKRRHELRPGITGWAQINGRNAISWNQKFEYDVWYVDHISFLLDLRIIWLTIAKVFKSEGINQEGHVTMERFKGNEL